MALPPEKEVFHTIRPSIFSVLQRQEKKWKA
jgi:hypothetical protein